MKVASAIALVLLATCVASQAEDKFSTKDKRSMTKLDCDDLKVRSAFFAIMNAGLEKDRKDYSLVDLEIIPKYRGRHSSICIYEAHYSDGQSNVVGTWQYTNSIGTDFTFWTEEYEPEPGDDE